MPNTDVDKLSFLGKENGKTKKKKKKKKEKGFRLYSCRAFES